MTQGVTGTYAFNGTELTLQPSSGRWVQRETIGIDGLGHPVYPAVRDFELIWDLIDISDLAQLNSAYELVGNTGTVVVDLPRYGATSYTFFSYSGCTLQEPQYDAYFEKHVMSVRLLIMNVRT